MPKISDTYSRAYKACGDILREEGRFPTIERVREWIGTNSPNLIKQAINDWTAALAVETRERLQRPGVPDQFLDAAEALWRLAQDEAERALAEQYAALKRERQALAENMEKVEAAHVALKREFESYRQGVERERDALQSRVAQQDKALHELRAAQTQITRERAEIREALARQTGALAEAKAAETRAREDWQIRFDQDHQWHLRRIEEEKDRLRGDAADTIARLNEALKAARQQIGDLTSQRDRLVHEAHERQGEQRVLQQEHQRLHKAHEVLHQTVIAQQKQLQACTESPSALKLRRKSTRLKP